jgi:hypothetical protein
VFVSAAFTIATASKGAAQVSGSSTSGPLFVELARMDSILFDAAFVSCDPTRFRSLFTADAEFYHDKVPPAYGEDVRTLQGCPKDAGVRRVLVQGSLRVYPIAEFGAIQMGKHRFLEDDAETRTIAKFVHLWSNRNGEWQIARVLSFDHVSERAR